MKKVAVLVAGGVGSRMKSTLPKQFLLIKQKPILYYTLKIFFEADDDFEIILVLPKEYFELGMDIIAADFNQKNIKLTEGGESRFHSVQNGLKLVPDNSVVFVHDAVRCLLSKDLIIRCYETAMHKGSAIPVVNSKDSIRMIAGETHQSINRDAVKLVQTPQVFLSNLILPAFQTEYSPSFTDEASVLEHQGIELHLVEGEENNIKITHPLDIYIAEKILSF